MAAQREAQALDMAVRHARSPRLLRWARAPLKLARLKRMNASKIVRARLFWGDTMLVTPPEPLSAQLFLYGFHELGMTRFMLEKVLPGMTVLDVGAHYGYYTLLAAHLVGPRGTVHAFEPAPSTAGILARNATDRGNVMVNQVAAWHCETELELQDFGPRRSMSNSVFAPRGWQGMGASVRVQAIALDDYVANLGLAPGFVKIDAESAEPHVIEGLANTLREHRPTLTLEVGDGAPDEPVSSRELLDMICEEYQYQPFEFSSGQIRPHKPRARYECDNIVFVAK
jgi:FkbM family methyltransferase